MSERFRWDMDRYDDPRFEGPRWGNGLRFLALIAAAAAAIGAVVAYGAEPDQRPTLWIYSASWCTPCHELHDFADAKDSPFHRFRIVWLPARPGMEIPQIAYWKANGKPGYFHGWGAGHFERFDEKWKRDTRRKP